ncbi:MAG: phage tail sheath C-terminal domain-containing protein [Pseudomonadota bacterium]
MYKHPGVYIEHVPSGVLAIEAASTSVTAFIGALPRGARVTASAGEPVFITSQTQYAQAFGAVPALAGGIADAGSNADAFGFAVSTFFANGGTKAYIVPVASTDGGAATIDIVMPEGTLTFSGATPGVWSRDLVVRISEELDGVYGLAIGRRIPLPGGGFKQEKVVNSDDAEVDVDALEVYETFTGLVLDDASGQFIESRVNGVSTLVSVSLAAAANPAVVTPLDGILAGGTDPAAPGEADYQAAFDRLKDYRDISIMVFPGVVWDTNGQPVLQRALTHAEFMQNRMVLVDPPNPATGGDALITPRDVQDAGFPTSPYAALYYPWLKVANPYFDADTAANKPKTLEVAPSGMAAGMWGRIDGTRGVWKAPAGLEATVRGSLGPNLLIGNAIQDNLNEWGVNCLRSIIGPPVVWGARTLATKTKPEFRYVPVRRTQSMIGESLYAALQAVVFEPNDHKLWSSLRASVGNFMDQLHRAGAFQGEKASDAYYVRCGLGATMTQADIDSGIVRVVVGFAPLKPAEFVVVQIQQIVGQSA